jgi:hypothetical protein
MSYWKQLREKAKLIAQDELEEGEISLDQFDQAVENIFRWLCQDAHSHDYKE